MKAWENNIRKVIPYVPGEQPKKEKMIKLNTNENPYPPAPGVKDVLTSFDTDRLRLYPDPKIEKLTDAIAERYGLNSNQVFVGVGSDDVLAMCFMTFFNSNRPILFPDITYSFYDVWAEEFRIPYKQIPLDRNFTIRPEDYAGENGDEAYIDFGGTSALPLIDKYDNVLVVQTFSKSRSMAGMRIGYAMAQPELIKYLNDVKYSFNSYTLNSLTIEMGTAAILDEAYFKETTQKIIATRERTKEELRALGYRMDDSKSNFLFVTHDTISMERLFEDLKKKDIYVRHFSKPERIANYLRITIGTDEEMDTLITFLKNYKQS